MAFSMAWAGGGASGDGEDEALGRLAGFRGEFFRCLTRRGDALFGVADAVLCENRRVTDLARLSLVPECGRGHGGLYDGVNAGRVEIGRLRRALAGLALPAWPDGRIRLAVDVCNWLRPDAETSGERLFCHVYGRGRNAGQVIPGWPYSFVAALGPGRSSWTLPLDAVRLRPHDDETEVTAAQLREVVARLIEAGHRKRGDPPVLIVMDSGYSGTRLAWLLRDLPVTVLARVRSDRVFYRPAPDRVPGVRGRNGRHGDPVRCAGPASPARPGPGRRCGICPARPAGGDGVGAGAPDDPPRLRRLGRLASAPGIPPHRGHADPAGRHPARPGPPGAGADVAVGRQPGRRARRGRGGRAMAGIPAPVRPGAHVPSPGVLKTQLGWDKPMLRDPGAADRWTWLIIACYAQLWLARDLAAGTRLPWQRPQAGIVRSQPMTPGRVRAGFRVVRQAAGTPASTGKYAKPGPGRPAGSRNKHKAPRRHVGKTILKQHSIDDKKRKQAKPARRTTEQAG